MWKTYLPDLITGRTCGLVLIPVSFKKKTLHTFRLWQKYIAYKLYFINILSTMTITMLCDKNRHRIFTLKSWWHGIKSDMHLLHLNDNPPTVKFKGTKLLMLWCCVCSCKCNPYPEGIFISSYFCVAPDLVRFPTMTIFGNACAEICQK